MWYHRDFKKPKILVYVQLRDSTVEINRSLVVFFDRNSNYFVQKNSNYKKTYYHNCKGGSVVNKFQQLCLKTAMHERMKMLGNDFVFHSIDGMRLNNHNGGLCNKLFNCF